MLAPDLEQVLVREEIVAEESRSSPQHEVGRLGHSHAKPSRQVPYPSECSLLSATEGPFLWRWDPTSAACA